jgi:endonuclease III
MSTFKTERDILIAKENELNKHINIGGEHKKKAVDILYKLCVDLLEKKYLSKQFITLEHRKG